MNRLSMILRILAIVAAIAAGSFFFIGKGKLAEQTKATLLAEQATREAQAELLASNEKVSSLEASLKTERNALADGKRKLDSIRSEMYTARQEVSRTQQQLSEAKRNIADLESKAKRLRSDLLQSEQSLASASKDGEIAQLNDRIEELEKANAELKASAEELNARAASTRSTDTATAGSVISYSSTYVPTPSQPLPVATLGAETTINQLSAENGLIVLANHPELGLTVGTQVMLIKERQAIGSIQVVQIKDDFVIANILPGAKTRAMTAGSTVSLLP